MPIIQRKSYKIAGCIFNRISIQWSKGVDVSGQGCLTVSESSKCHRTPNKINMTRSENDAVCLRRMQTWQARRIILYWPCLDVINTERDFQYTRIIFVLLFKRKRAIPNADLVVNPSSVWSPAKISQQLFVRVYLHSFYVYSIMCQNMDQSIQAFHRQHIDLRETNDWYKQIYNI